MFWPLSNFVFSWAAADFFFRNVGDCFEIWREESKVAVSPNFESSAEVMLTLTLSHLNLIHGLPGSFSPQPPAVNFFSPFPFREADQLLRARFAYTRKGNKI